MRLKRVLTGALALAMSLGLLALEPDNRVPMPDPNLALEQDTFSILVITANADDPGVHAFTDSFWSQLTEQGGKLPSGLGTLTQYISQEKARDALARALPLQVVRTDQIARDGKLHSINMITLSGWKGLQTQFFKSLVKDKDGKDYPCQLYRRADIYTRESGQLSRLNGTFLYVSSLDRMKLLVERLLDKKPAKTLEWEPHQGAEISGVAVNQARSFAALIKAAEGEPLNELRQKLGAGRLDQGVLKLKRVNYWLDVVSDDEAVCSFHLVTAPGADQEVAALVRDLPAAMALPELPSVDVQIPSPDVVDGQFKLSGIKKRIKAALNVPQ